ncbi:LuxR family transcriptional regulator [Kitasatospora mediocidica]|uniref:LuxR family transcriptional regulator n=1 Tax=Kitasatospora mediocidica TaxID=58352 RepID=UPI00068C9347|nr:LuxR family transcriptional regulator [Kitasatospora mediocidica]
MPTGASTTTDQDTAPPGDDQPPPPSLTAALYEQATARESISLEELLTAAGAPAEEAHAAVRRLERLRLLRSRPGEPGHFVPVAPATASAQVLLPAIRELRDQQAMINQMCAELSDLLPVYERSALKRSREELLHRLDDVDAVRLAISELSARATREILTSQPGGPRPEHVLRESRDRTVQVLERGVPMRTLYQYSAQFHQPTADHVALLVELGADVRVVNDAFMRLIVFDREVAIIEMVDNDQGALLVRDMNIIHFVVRAFERAWDRALQFPLAHERGQVLQASEEMKTAIVRLLVEGYDDRVIAKRLGISLRTFQRHLSEVLRRIGAHSRVHAGYLIRELGMLDGTGGPAEHSVRTADE